MLDRKAPLAGEMRRDLPPLERATRFLQEELSHAPVAATRIEALAQQRGIGHALDEAKEALGVTAERRNSGHGNVVHWTLPETT
jgi:hypothetical protein